MIPVLLFACLAAWGSPGGTAGDRSLFLNQAGYLPEAAKIILTNEPADSFFIRNYLDNTIVYRGALTLAATNDPSTGMTLYRGNFTALTRPGIYRAAVNGLSGDAKFAVSASVYEPLYRSSLKGFYFQRCGMELAAAFADAYTHPACHLNDGILHSSTGSGGLVQSTGGWHDAGDFGKYVVNAGVSVGTLLMAYELFPDRFGQDDLRIPESGNGIPDLLDEVRWELRWLLSMQKTDGGVYAKLTRTQFEPWIMPNNDRDIRYIYEVSSAATADFAAMMAQGARVYQRFDPAFAETCRTRSLRAWTWLEANPFIVPTGGFRNPQGTATGEYGYGNDGDERLWAAAELFVATGLEKFQSYYTFHASSGPLMNWPQVRTMANISYLKNRQTGTDSLFRAKVRSWIIALANEQVGRRNQSGFGVVLQPGEYNWGSNSDVLYAAVVLLAASTESANPAYVAAALDQLHYILGRNGLAKSFVTGAGNTPVMYPHHRSSVADGIAPPVPGLLAGGPNQYRSDEALRALFTAQTPPALCYRDTVPSYASNEIAINWNAPLVVVAGYFSAPAGPAAAADEKTTPTGFRLEQNYPNPFNGTTLIRFSLSGADQVRFTVFDLLGRVLTTEDLGLRSAGEHVALWPPQGAGAGQYSSGVYFYRIDGAGERHHGMQKMVLMN